jgi:hypothetical protein
MYGEQLSIQEVDEVIERNYDEQTELFLGAIAIHNIEAEE